MAAGNPRQLWLRAAIWLSVYAATAGIVFGLSWMRFPNFLGGCVDFVERPYYSLLTSPGDWLADHVQIIRLVDFPDTAHSAKAKEWRPRHARILKELVAAQARVVAFDLAFDEWADEKLDGEFIEALQNTGATRVVLGYDPNHGDPNAGIRSAFASLPVSFGRIRAGQTPMAPGGPRYVLLGTAAQFESPSLEPALPLQVKLAYDSTGAGGDVRATLDLPGRQLRLHANGVAHGAIPVRVTVQRGQRDQVVARMLIQSIAKADFERIATTTYEHVEGWVQSVRERANLQRFAGKIVLIGPENTEDQTGTGEHALFGYAVHAAAISALVQGLHPRELGIPSQITLLFGLSVAAGLCRVLVPAGRQVVTVPFLSFKLNVPITLVALILVFVAIAARLFAANLIMVDPLYDVMALMAGYWLAGVLQAHAPIFPVKEAAAAPAGATGGPAGAETPATSGSAKKESKRSKRRKERP